MVSAQAQSAFYHGNKRYEAGDTAEFTKAEAADMEKSGLIKITGDAEAKAEAAPLNKMTDATANKGEAKPAKAK